MRRVFLFIICVALGLAMILSGYLIFDYYLDQLKAESAYDELSEFAIPEEAVATEPASNSTADDTTEHPETDSLVSVDFEKLTAEYPDTVGCFIAKGHRSIILLYKVRIIFVICAAFRMVATMRRARFLPITAARKSQLPAIISFTGIT